MIEAILDYSWVGYIYVYHPALISLLFINVSHPCKINYRGMTSNMTAVAIPIAVTIFMTDVLKTKKIFS